MLLKIISQTLQLFTKINKTESICNNNSNAKLNGLGEERPSGPIKRGSGVLLELRVENVFWEQISLNNLNYYSINYFFSHNKLNIP